MIIVNLLIKHRLSFSLQVVSVLLLFELFLIKSFSHCQIQKYYICIYVYQQISDDSEAYAHQYDGISDKC